MVYIVGVLFYIVLTSPPASRGVNETLGVEDAGLSAYTYLLCFNAFSCLSRLNIAK